MATPIPVNDAPLSAWVAAAVTGGTIVRARDGVTTRGITSDSRAVAPGSAFVALRGEKHDGHDYLAAAIEAGARLVIVEKGHGARALATATVDVVEVDDTLVAWGDLARAHLRAWRRLRRDGVVFAVTGSAGKTTTKELCAALLRTADSCHAAAGNLNNRVGVPAVAFGLEPRHRFAVFEAGMNRRGEIAELARILEPDVGILTNVGVAHAEGVGGTRADVAREKGDLLAALAEDAVAVVRHDDAAAVGQLARTRAQCAVTFGILEGADYRVVARAPAALGGAEVGIARGDGTVLVAHLPLAGEAAALDLAAALAAVESIIGRMTPDAVGTALARHLASLPGRMQTRHLANGITVLDDTYNANPESVRAALRTLGEMARGRRGIVVLGEMRELGAIAAEEHALLGSAIVASGASVAVSCGGLAELAIAEAERAGLASARGTDANAAALLTVGLVRAGDVVLVKASRSIGAEKVVEALIGAGGGEIAALRGAS